MTDADWREFGSGLGDGIVNSTSPGGSSDFAVALSSSDRSLVLNLGQIRIRGVQFRPTPSNATVSFTLPDVASGSTRSDRIVARYDPAAADVDKIVMRTITGTAVTSGTPTRPGITRVAGGIWEVPLHLFTGGAVTSDTLTHEDHRVFVTSHLHGLTPPGGNTTLNQGFPDGTQYFDLPTGMTWVQTYPAGVATWGNVDDPDWSNLNIGGGMVAGTSTPQYRVKRGELQMRGNGRRLPASNGGVWDAAAGAIEQVVGTLPASVAPSVQHTWSAGVEGGMRGSARMYVRSNGQITVTIVAGESMSGVYYDAVRYQVGG